MPRYILVAIDGTGSTTWGRDARGHASVNGQQSVIVNSYVNMFYHDFDPQGGDKIYLHGPSNGATGSDSTGIMATARTFINSTLRALLPISRLEGPQLLAAGSRDTSQEERARVIANSDVEFVFIGHSRGGAMAISLAQGLEKRVHFMGLYDAVDRSTYIDNTETISNVKTCYHARRDPEVGSRITFSNCGTQMTGGEYREAFFMTAHGGIGGDESTGGGNFDDYSCDVSSDFLSITPRIISPAEYYGLYTYITNSVSQGRLMSNVCRTESIRANTFVRDGARRSGITLRGR